MKPAGLRAGYHNHQLEFKPIDGKRPIEVLAANTSKDVMLQLDVGTSIEAARSGGLDRAEPRPYPLDALQGLVEGQELQGPAGRGRRALEEAVPSSRKDGRIEFYLIEQEGSDYPPLETASRCLANFRKLHG